MLYGYLRKQDGTVVIDPEQAELVQRLFSRFADGETLTFCCEGLPFAPQTCKKMLGNRAYLGDTSHPPIITADLFNRVQSELAKRSVSRKRKAQPNRIQVVPVHLHFTLRSGVHTGMTPQQMYEMVIPASSTSSTPSE